MNSNNKLGKGILALTVVLLMASLFIFIAQAVVTDCAYNGKKGICEDKGACDKVSGTWVAASQGATGCEKLPSQIRCCIEKDNGSASEKTATATVAFESKPVTLTSDKVFLETYDKKSKIIDASKITYGGKPIFEDAASILDNENPNMGGRVEVTVKVFNNIDEQIDTMTFVMKAGGDLWEYTECGDDSKGRCALPGDVLATDGREPKDGTNGDFLTQCKQGYDKQGFGDLFKSSLKTMACYVPKSAAQVKTETKTETSIADPKAIAKDVEKPTEKKDCDAQGDETHECLSDKVAKEKPKYVLETSGNYECKNKDQKCYVVKDCFKNVNEWSRVLLLNAIDDACQRRSSNLRTYLEGPIYFTGKPITVSDVNDFYTKVVSSTGSKSDCVGTTWQPAEIKGQRDGDGCPLYSGGICICPGNGNTFYVDAGCNEGCKGYDKGSDYVYSAKNFEPNPFIDHYS